MEKLIDGRNQLFDEPFDNYPEDDEDLLDELREFDEDFSIEDIESETETEEVFLEYADDTGGSYDDCERRIRRALEEYSAEEILAFNELDVVEAVTEMYLSNSIGLPTVIEYESEEEQDLPPEEDQEE